MPVCTFSCPIQCLFKPCVLLTVSLFGSDPEQVTVQPGDDVTLQCPAGTEASIIKLKWTIADLVSKRYVFFFRENRSYEHYQDPSFRGRVGLKDPEMKDGDASVILKKVTVNDTGTYECELSLDNLEGCDWAERAVDLDPSGVQLLDFCASCSLSLTNTTFSY
uniref:Ig-like domain-containing protein n=1 Tax=Mola mola TaxID=94237 RepID=A0A3Q3WYQ7_MOLML